MIKKLYPYRYQLFLITQLSVLFGSLIFPSNIYDVFISPVLNLANIFAGLILLFKKKRLLKLIGILVLLVIISFATNIVEQENIRNMNFLRLVVFFTFHLVVIRELISQIWKTKFINEKTILGLISGLVSLGFIGFFMFMLAEFFHPGSFSMPDFGISKVQNLLYFSYVTLFTIGYGEIVPVTDLAQKIVILIGLTGQLYMLVLVGIIIGKYIGQKQ